MNDLKIYSFVTSLQKKRNSGAGARNDSEVRKIEILVGLKLLTIVLTSSTGVATDFFFSPFTTEVIRQFSHPFVGIG